MTRPAESPVHPLPPVPVDATDAELFRRPPSVDELRAVARRRERLAATTPPPVRVVRLAGGLESLLYCVGAAYNGQRAVELATRGDGSDGLQVQAHVYHARRAAHLARLALGASS